MKYGLHRRPADLRARLQAKVDAAQGQGYDAVGLIYGLCGQATAGLRAGQVPLIIPRAHDCITLFLGGRDRYRQQFEDYPGTYWYAHDYLERDDGTGASLSAGSGSDEDMQKVYDGYVEKYGQDNAAYLMEVMGAWQSHYQRAVYVDMGVADGSRVEARAQAEAARRGWTFERIAGDLVLVRRLLAGDWGDDFLTVPPGQEIKMAYDENVVECVCPMMPGEGR
jgi:hypothetical protein